MPELVDSINCAKCGAPLPLATGEVVVTCPYCGSVLRLHAETPFLLRQYPCLHYQLPKLAGHSFSPLAKGDPAAH